MEELEKRGIESRRFFYPLHIMPAYKEYVADHENFPVTIYLSDHGLNLPSGPKIDDEEVIEVAKTIKQLHKKSC